MCQCRNFVIIKISTVWDILNEGFDVQLNEDLCYLPYPLFPGIRMFSLPRRQPVTISGTPPHWLGVCLSLYIIVSFSHIFIHT
jgi:hypothetical protein